VKERGVIVVPLKVRFGDSEYQDGVNIDADRFYQLLMSSPKFPVTSQPSVGEFLQVYKELTDRGHQILSIHISAKLSGTYNSAVQAKNTLEAKDKVEVFDSAHVSLSLGLMVLEAARLAAEGQSMQDILVKTLEQSRDKFHLFGVMGTLEYLQKGGRIGKAQAFLGSLLNIKPIVAIKEGVVHPVERVRSRAKAVDRVVAMVKELAPVRSIAVIHSTAPEEAEQLARRLSEFVPVEGIIRARIGPVVGAYIGPGGVGVAVQQ
jgi:DegV family protein with EDD domain